MEINPEDFDLSFRVQHWSGCWGGTVPKTPVHNTADFLKRLDSAWLGNFLCNTDPKRLTVETVDHSDDGRSKELADSEYLAAVYFEDGHYSRGRIPIIVTCSDGKPLYSREEYDELMVGRGLFRGYRLKPNNYSYTLIYPYKETPDGLYDHLNFKSPYGTIIGSHIFFVENGLVREGIELSSLVPEHTSLVVHYPENML